MRTNIDIDDELINRAMRVYREHAAGRRSADDSADALGKLEDLRWEEDENDAINKEIQAMVEADELSLGHAKALLMLEDEPIILRTAAKVTAEALSVRKTEALVQALLYPERKEKANPPHEAPDPNVREAQFQLQRTLGMKVTIHDKQGKGRIVIEYASLEDFDRVVETLAK